MKFVANSSPLIFLAKLNILHFLEEDDIFIPESVQNELLAKESVEKDQLEQFFKNPRVHILVPKKTIECTKVLGKGEIDVIALALEKKILHVLLDDRRARSLARVRGLRPHGTLFLILYFYKKGLIKKSKAAELILRLPGKGFRIDSRFLIEAIRTLEN